jgi:hypothetical protein
MDTSRKYRNRYAELEKLINVLRQQGIANVEELTLMLVRVIRSYAAQLGLEPLRPREVEYVWQRLID